LICGDLFWTGCRKCAFLKPVDIKAEEKCMGFLDNLFNKEARKIITNVVDSVVDNVTDTIKESMGTAQPSASCAPTNSTSANSSSAGSVTGGNTQAATQKASAASASGAQAAYKKRNASGREGLTGDDADCDWDVSVIRKRIEAVAAEDWSSYELRKNIPASEVGGGAKDQGFDYGLYLNGQPKLMIMLLDQYQHRNKCVQRSHQACKARGIGSFHLMFHLPNRKTYIAERMKECMPQ